MLTELLVRDLALVSQARVRFGGGLNLLTGETGSGKSLIVDALGLVLGARGSLDQVRHGAERATVDGWFVFGDRPVELRRELGKRGAARIDGRAATPGQLRDLGRGLVAIHGQHEQHDLLDSETQTEMLDAFAGALSLRGAVAAAHAAWASAAAAQRDLELARTRDQREQEFMRWQLDELRRAGLVTGEDTELTAERAAVRHSARLSELSHAAAESLGADLIAEGAEALRSAAELDSRLLGESDRAAALLEEARDLGATIRRYAEVLGSDPGRLEAIETRLAELEAIKRKHGGSLEAAIAARDRLERMVGLGADLETALHEASQLVEQRRATLIEAAGRLSEARRDAAVRVQSGVLSELASLRLEGARFEVALRALPEVGPAGAELAEMMFSANPGEPVAPLARVASGGELARLMLAVKTVGADSDRIPTLVFDEIDSGIGGEAALQVGLRLKRLGASHQVLVVTHLAQIACFADHHLVVEKAPGPDGRNVVSVRELAGVEARAVELARMMSGGVTAKAVARARELLQEARQA